MKSGTSAIYLLLPNLQPATLGTLNFLGALEMSSEDIRGEVSLVVAVVGHRDLLEKDKVFDGVLTFFKDLKAKYQNTDLLVITGMAEGADCVAVQAADRLEINCVAVLPFDEDAYFSTFTTVDSAEQARKLMHGKRKIVLPTLEENKTADLSTDTKAQNRQFQALAQFLVESSQVLLAVYDNNPTGKQGGTSDAISFKLGKKPLPGLKECSGLNNSGVGPVHYVVANRESGGHGPLPIRTQAPDYPVYRVGASQSSYEKIYRLQDEFNENVKSGDPLKLKVAESRKCLYPNIEESRGLHAGMDWTADRFAWADALATHNQDAAARYWCAVFLLLAFAVLAVVPLHVLPWLKNNKWLEICYYTAVLGAFVLGITERKKGFRRRHEDYRALAEALRIQYFWLASGLKTMVSEFYLSKQTGELVWVRDTMSEVLLESVHFLSAKRTPAQEQSGIAAARTWIESQEHFYESRAVRWGSRAKAFSLGSLVAFVVAFSLQMSATAAFHLDHHFEWDLPHLEEAERWVRVVTTILIGWSALARSYGELNNYEQIKRQYDESFKIFSLAGKLLQHDNDVGEASARERAHKHARQVIEDLGKAALQENGDWLMMHRDRKLDITIGGG